MRAFCASGMTKFCFLFGSSIEKTLSPTLHNGWFTQNNLDSIYLPCQILEEEHLESLLLPLLKVDNFLGANLTMPFKSTLVGNINLNPSSVVKDTGCANTIYKSDELGWCLGNTDIYGIQRTVQHLMVDNLAYNMIIIGGGGAAASCIYFGDKQDSKCKQIFCLTRDPDKTLLRYPMLKQNKKLKIFSLNLENINKVKEICLTNTEINLVINATPLNLKYENVIIEMLKLLESNKTCYFDMIYQPTFAIQYACKVGIKTVDGKFMLKEQAKESFFLWTDVRVI